jgi:hypothetical protein
LAVALGPTPLLSLSLVSRSSATSELPRRPHSLTILALMERVSCLDELTPPFRHARPIPLPLTRLYVVQRAGRRPRHAGPCPSTLGDVPRHWAMSLVQVPSLLPKPTSSDTHRMRRRAPSLLLLRAAGLCCRGGGLGDVAGGGGAALGGGGERRPQVMEHTRPCRRLYPRGMREVLEVARWVGLAPMGLALDTVKAVLAL